MANEFNQLLRERPLDLFRRHAVSPPGMAPGQTTTSLHTIWRDAQNKVLTEGGVDDTIGNLRVTSGGIKYINLKQSTDPVKRGSLTFSYSDGPQDDAVPVHFLPWRSQHLYEMHLPEVGADIDNIDANPRIFFTAALSGCSVFVDGNPARPRIVHAGIDGALKTDTAKFWRKQLHTLAKQRGQLVEENLQEINRNNYTDTVDVIAYKRWLQARHSDRFSVKEVKEWASVFGIRFGRLWSFYLQRNATITTMRFVKKSDVTKRFVNDSRTDFLDRNGVNLNRTVTKRRFRSDKKVYVATEVHNRPMDIKPFYPQGDGTIRIKDTYASL